MWGLTVSGWNSLLSRTSKVIVIYVDLLNGVRSYYARREGDDWIASFSAIMVMTGLLTLNLMAAMIMVESFFFGEPRFSEWVGDHRPTYLLGPLGVAGAHAFLAWKAGIFSRNRPAASSAWPRRLRFYVAATAFLVCAALLMTFATTHS